MKEDFRVWIEKFNKDQSPIGDLARDIALDHTFPSPPDIVNRFKDRAKEMTYDDWYSEILEHISSGRCEDAIKTFKKAWKLYVKECS